MGIVSNIFAFLAFQPWGHNHVYNATERIQLFVLLVGILLVAVGFGPVIRNHQWKARARAASGRVVDHVVDEPVVEFDVGESHVRFVGHHEPRDAEPLGTVVDVLYDPSQPEKARLAATRVRPSFLFGVGVVVMVIGVLTTWI